MPGRFITLEGGEGAGKSTQARLLAMRWWRSACRCCVRANLAAHLARRCCANLLLGGSVDWSAPAETLLHFAARAEHVEKTIRPALAAGMWVVCDRFYDSTMAYQGYGQGADRDMIATLIALLGMVPDVTLVLDVSDAVAVARQIEAWRRCGPLRAAGCVVPRAGEGRAFATSRGRRRSAAC